MNKPNIIALRFKGPTGRMHYVECYETDLIGNAKNILRQKYPDCTDSIVVRKENGEIINDDVDVMSAADGSECLYFFFSSLVSEGIKKNQNGNESNPYNNYTEAEKAKITKIMNEMNVDIDTVVCCFELSKRNVKKTKEEIIRRRNNDN